MTGEFSKLPFSRIIMAGVAVVVLSTLAVTLVITGYAFFLAFQARGAPDQKLISQFAQRISSVLAPVLEILLTFVSAKWVRRKSRTTKLSSGLFVGIVVVLVANFAQYIFGEPLRTIDALWFALILMAGWLGGRPRAMVT